MRAELQALEALVFPWIGPGFMKRSPRLVRTRSVRFIVLDAAIMVEAGWDENCDRVIFVDVPRQLRLDACCGRRGWSEQEVASREKAQLPWRKNARRADAVDR